MEQLMIINDNFQNWKPYNIPKAQLIIADVPYNLGKNAYASNPIWYEGGDNSNGESDWERIEILPDQVADFTSMPYPDGTFRMVVFDPPHELRNTGMSKFTDLFGSLNPNADVVGMPDYIQWRYSDWKGVIAAGFRECFRVLQDGGFLIFKWSDVDVPLREVLELTDRRPVFGHHSGKRSRTHWLCFMK